MAHLTIRKPILNALPEAKNEVNEEFNTITYTIGGMMMIPSNRIDGKMTINGARGFHPRIADRFDLTLECIRRYYQPEKDDVTQVIDPLRKTLRRYGDFFSLFTDFRGYVEFFLLQDLVTGDDSEVRFLMPFADFETPAVPSDIDTYLEYRRRTTEFVNARNARINTWAIGIFWRHSDASGPVCRSNRRTGLADRGSPISLRPSVLSEGDGKLYVTEPGE